MVKKALKKTKNSLNYCRVRTMVHNPCTQALCCSKKIPKMVFIWGALYEFLFYTSPIRESGSNHRPPQSLFAGRRVDENFGSYEFLEFEQILLFVLVQRIFYQSQL